MLPWLLFLPEPSKWMSLILAPALRKKYLQ
ncbi:Uncharacterised protein [Klebsiella pneumoniae]|uniref:Uncharacterized protein n=1 Tax=Klebsiella pneumoniae TaxID=573 RepID=A0A378F0K3_KLEPN|nr:Uncharacterised protein [Klebsiella pneumoniae]STW38532.1 Uncharacterised protein [Klebsiella pneumoniae]STW46898.1 Uncharacterised protein [Klebsiella pneumoniae]